MKKKLFDYVHEVLSINELIIVPDFGAFIVQKTTTFLNDGEYISIIFSAQQQNDDGVLKKYIAQQQNISEGDAEEFIEIELEEIYNNINETGIFKVDGIGEFRAINDRIVFKPFDDQYLVKEEAKEIKNTAEFNKEKENPIVNNPDAQTGNTPTKKGESPTPNSKPESTPENKIVEKIDIETIRQTYAQRNTTEQDVNKAEEKVVQKVPEKQAEAKPTKVKKEPKPINYSKLVTPLIIIAIIGVLGILGYVFRNEIADLNKPSVTNDTTQVVIEQGMGQLADTLNEIQNLQDDSVASIQQTEDVTSGTKPTSEGNTPTISAGSEGKVFYGSNTTTLYYVTKASFRNKQDALTEESNLDYTGFDAKVIETDGTKKYHVVVAEFSDLQLAKEELNFSKKIDNSFYLMTVKPRQ